MLNKKISKIDAHSLTGLSVLLWLSGTALAQDGTSLIGHWALDNGASDAVGAYNGRLIGIGAENPDLPVAVPGKTGQALEFNGGMGVEIPIDLDHRTHSALTVTMWVRLGDTPRAAGTQTLISTGAGDGPRIELARDQVRASAGGRVLGPKYALRAGDWNFVAVSWDHAAGSMSMTVNNTHAFYPLGYEAKRSQQTYISPRDPDLEKYGRKGAQKRYLWIGAKDGFGKQSSLKDVAIDDVRVYGGVLDGDQLVELSGGISNGTYIPPELRGIASTWAPDIGDRVGEVGVLPKLFGEDQPPDIGDGSAADSGQRVMMGQADSLPGSNERGEVNDLPTSVMPAGGSTTGLSQSTINDLQQSSGESAPIDMAYDSEKEGETAAAHVEEQRQLTAPRYSVVLGETSHYRDELDLVTEYVDTFNIPNTHEGCSLTLNGKRFDFCAGGRAASGAYLDLPTANINTLGACLAAESGDGSASFWNLYIGGETTTWEGKPWVQEDYEKGLSRPDCAGWAIVTCPSGTAATGFVAHTTENRLAGARGRVWRGIQMICRAQVWQEFKGGQ